ncbi:hypothetical protein [Actinomadura violacea]|uniref:hypothetical protein n=1 Tax=Actinomadura violacea TaxID=2819934 RepID=UPI001E42A993|nr:hypothetical protein [Actinomadura violacea]
MKGLTEAEIRSLPATIDLVTAGRVFGVGRTKAYQLARTGDFPCRVLRVGRNYRVATADLITALGLNQGLNSGLKPGSVRGRECACVDRPGPGGQPAPQENV